MFWTAEVVGKETKKVKRVNLDNLVVLNNKVDCRSKQHANKKLNRVYKAKVDMRDEERNYGRGKSSKLIVRNFLHSSYREFIMSKINRIDINTACIEQIHTVQEVGSNALYYFIVLWHFLTLLPIRFHKQLAVTSYISHTVMPFSPTL